MNKNQRKSIMTTVHFFITYYRGKNLSITLDLPFTEIHIKIEKVRIVLYKVGNYAMDEIIYISCTLVKYQYYSKKMVKNDSFAHDRTFHKSLNVYKN